MNVWHLPKPDLQKTLDDVDVFESLGIITSAENPVLKQLVCDYDNQNAVLTQSQISTISTSTADKIRLNYNLTHKGRKLSAIRRDLFNNVPYNSYCPYCGISEFKSLDHYMDKSTYGTMALCRLNLVPMCMLCNGSKSTKPYTDFINPYYLLDPSVEFFICTITVCGNDIVYGFSIKKGVFTNQQTSALEEQIKEIGLNKRWKKAAISYLQENLFCDYNTPQSLIASLPSLIQKRTNSNMLNHWQTAVLRGLKQVINGNAATAQKILDAVNNKAFQQGF